MPQFETLTPAQVLVERARPGVKLVDVRTTEEYLEEHIPDSLHLPLQDLPSLVHVSLAPDDEIIVYCQHGVRSKHAAQFLVTQGFTNVSHMAGGLAVWNGPVEPE